MCPTHEGKEFWYRYEDYVVSAGVDEFDNSVGPGIVEVTLRRLVVLRRTPKGVWLDVNGRERFVLTGARKRYACCTDAEARESFLARKKAQARIYDARAARARAAIRRLDRVSAL